MINGMVFIGGCATGRLITDPAATPVRTTIDVGVLVEVTSPNHKNLRLGTLNGILQDVARHLGAGKEEILKKR